MDILGPAISTVQVSGDVLQQFVEAGLMRYDGNRAPDDRFTFAPLGLGFEISEETRIQGINAGNSRPIRELIYGPFLSIYERLGGARFVGLPLTGSRFNAAKNRYEQYFENFGFYQFENDDVRLMAYGAFACGRACRYEATAGSIPSLQPNLAEPFVKKALELGQQFTGNALTDVYPIQDNRKEVIFENVVLIVDEDLGMVQAKPIVEELGFHPQPLQPRLDGPLMEFIPVLGDLGHNVPVYFLDYLDQHGGLELSGLPLGEIISDQSGKFWQCFENLCLEFDLNKAGASQLKPVPLGSRYKELVYDKARSFLESQSMDGVEIKVWENSSFVSVTDSQEIYARIYQDGSPLRNREPILYISMPDGEVRQASFPPTDAAGRTMLKLAPIRASNGTLVAYQVCLVGFKDQHICVSDIYLVWNS
jgi:hypothetical protein